METVENEKGFRVLKIDRTELLSKTARFGAIGVCDRCGHAPHTGYYILVGTQAEQKKYIGNAVEVNMSRVLCESLCAALVSKAIAI